MPKVKTCKDFVFACQLMLKTKSDGSSLQNRPHSTNDLPVGISPLGNPAESIAGNESAHFNFLDDVYFQKIGGQVNPNGQRRDSVAVGTGDPVDILLKDGLEPQDSFGRWMNYIMTDSPVSVDDPSLGSPVSSSHDSVVSAAGNHQQSSVPDTIFSITDFSPSWAISTEKTKVFSLCYHFLLLLGSIYCCIYFFS